MDKNQNAEISTPEELVRNFPQAIERAKRVMRNFEIPEEDKDEILQNALLTLIKKSDKIRNTESWLIGTVKKNCMTYWRKRRDSLTNAVDAAILDLLEMPPQVDNSDLAAVLDSLSPRCRQLLMLRYGLGYGASDTAEALGYHVTSVRKVTTRCLSSLVRLLLAKAQANINRTDTER